MMGGVRGDVIALDLVQTTIMEMGQPPGEQGDAPSMWVRARQYTGRIVIITNDKIFDEPVYNTAASSRISGMRCRSQSPIIPTAARLRKSFSTSRESTPSKSRS